MPFTKTGALSRSELTALWKSVTDREYNRPLLEQPQSGIEFFEQGHEQLARASEMVNRVTQSLYILPWSGQTDEPASGEAFATVVLSLTRINVGVVDASFPIVITPEVFFHHAPEDYSTNGPLEIRTGRRYMPTQPVVIGVGVLGPVQVPCVAEVAMAGYNLPQPNTIQRFDQPGSDYSNDGASVVPQQALNRLVLAPRAEVLAPTHVGQYVLFTAGSNEGRMRRIVGYEAVQPGNGGVALLAATAHVQITTVVGTFVPGEVVTQTPSGATATLYWNDSGWAVLEMLSGTLATAQTFTGAISGATATLSQIIEQPALTAETETAEWRVLSWVDDFGLSCTNLESPTGGRTPMLDELGEDRKIPRAIGETDETYRERVATPADVVSPNAIIRATNRVLAPLGFAVCFREVGTALLPGFFFEVDAFDYDFDVRPQDRFKLLLDYTEFRAFFLIGVPEFPAPADFGFAFDDHPHNGFDTITPYTNFFDGQPSLEAQTSLYSAVWQAANNTRAGGVSFDMYVENVGCF